MQFMKMCKTKRRQCHRHPILKWNQLLYAERAIWLCKWFIYLIIYKLLFLLPDKYVYWPIRGGWLREHKIDSTNSKVKLFNMNTIIQMNQYKYKICRNACEYDIHIRAVLRRSWVLRQPWRLLLLNGDNSLLRWQKYNSFFFLAWRISLY